LILYKLSRLLEDEQDLAVTNVGDNDLLVKTALDRRGNNRDNNYTNNDLTDTLVDATLPLMKMTFTSMTIMQTNPFLPASDYSLKNMLTTLPLS